jgi:co-chaperonin GroES (HSP10)
MNKPHHEQLSIKPEHDYVFVKHTKVKQTTMASGVIVAEVNKFADILNGTVVAVSDSSPYPLTVNIADTVWFTEQTIKTKTILDGKEYLVLSEKDLLAYRSH